MVPTTTIVSPESLRNKPVTDDGRKFIAIVIATVSMVTMSMVTASND